MRKLRVYGDSFAAKTMSEHFCWADYVGKNLELEVINNAITGSSTEYSVKMLINDINSITNDIIIFVTSTPGRLHFRHQNYSRPETAVQYLHGAPDNGLNHSWYHDNKDHIEWWMGNVDHQLLGINHEAYIHLIRGIAKSNPDAIFLVIPNSDHRIHIDGGTNPPNFLTTNVCLNEISQFELDRATPTYREWVQYSIYDYRINHLSNPNIKILSTLVTESIQNMSLDNITYDKFKTNFLHPIRSIKQYHDYVDLGYLTYAKWVEKQLTKTFG